MRGGDDVLELEQRAVGARLAGEDVEAGGGDPALLERHVERVLVDDAAAGGVDEHQAGLDLGELVLADEPDGLRGLRQVHGDEVGLGEQLVEGHQADAHLRGAAGLHVGVVGDDLHAEGRQPLRDQHADAAEADDADGLLVELDAGVLAALPLAVLERGAGRRDVAGGREHQRDRELGGGDDVGGRRVDDHDAGLGGGLDVDVVEADAGAGDDLQLRGRREGLGVDLGGGADEDRVDVGDGRQQLGAVGAVAVRISKSGPRASTVAGRQLFGDEYDGLAHVESSSVVVSAGSGHRTPSSTGGGRARRCAHAGTLRRWASASQRTPWPDVPVGSVPTYGRRPRSRRTERPRWPSATNRDVSEVVQWRVSGRRCPRCSPVVRLRPSSSARAARDRSPRSGAARPGAQRLELRRAGVLVGDEALGEGAVLDVGEDRLHVRP